MSFAKDSKLEIIEERIEDADCAQAFISGLLHSSGTITRNGSELFVDRSEERR